MRYQRRLNDLLVATALSAAACSADTNLVISAYQGNGQLTFGQVENAIEYSVEWASSAEGPWANSWEPLAHIPTNELTNITVDVPMFYRVLAWYSQPAGALRVEIVPSAAASAGAQWNLGTGTWYNSGFVLTGLIPNTYTVSFKSVTGWVEPTPTDASIVEGMTSICLGVYAPVLEGGSKNRRFLIQAQQ